MKSVIFKIGYIIHEKKIIYNQSKSLDSTCIRSTFQLCLFNIFNVILVIRTVSFIHEYNIYENLGADETPYLSIEYMLVFLFLKNLDIILIM